MDRISQQWYLSHDSFSSSIRDERMHAVIDADLTIFDIGSIDEGDFYVKFRLRNKADGFH